MKVDMNVEDAIKIVKTAGEFFKYSADKKAESSKYHDDTLKAMNEKDNKTKSEAVGLIVSLLTPVAVAVAAMIQNKAKAEN